MPYKVNLENQPDFKNVKLTTDQPEDYTWQERRAEIYQIIKKKGHPDVNRAKLGRRYNVSREQISKDIQVLQQYIAENNDLDEFVTTGKLNWKKGISELQRQGKYLKANKLWESWKEFLYEEGIREKAPDKQQVEIKNDLDNAFSRAEKYLKRQHQDQENK